MASYSGGDVDRVAYIELPKTSQESEGKVKTTVLTWAGCNFPCLTAHERDGKPWAVEIQGLAALHERFPGFIQTEEDAQGLVSLAQLIFAFSLMVEPNRVARHTLPQLREFVGDTRVHPRGC